MTAMKLQKRPEHKGPVFDQVLAYGAGRSINVVNPEALSGPQRPEGGGGLRQGKTAPG